MTGIIKYIISKSGSGFGAEAGRRNDVTNLFVNTCLSFSLRVCVSVCVDVSLDIGTHRSQFQSFLT